MSEIRVTSVVGENGGDRVGLTTGLTVGPLTGTTGIGATISHQGHAQFAGVCTATSFVGSGANLTGLTAGITEFDSWYLTSNVTSNGDITANLSRENKSGNAYPLGTGMSESSGVFTFPNTGKWLVIVNATFQLNGADNVAVDTYVTLNNSSYTLTHRAIDGNNGSGGKHGSGTSFAFIDVTDTSQVKVKFAADSIGSGSYVTAEQSYVQTSFLFVRIGDT